MALSASMEFLRGSLENRETNTIAYFRLAWATARPLVESLSFRPPSSSVSTHSVFSSRNCEKTIEACNWCKLGGISSLLLPKKRERGTQLEMERLCGTWPANVDRGEHCRVWSARLAGGITFTASNWPSTGSACVRAPERAAARPLRPSHRQDYIAGGQSEPFDVASAKRDRAGDDFPPSPTRRFSHFLKRANANRRPPRNGRTTGRRNERPPLFLSSH